MLLVPIFGGTVEKEKLGTLLKYSTNRSNKCLSSASRLQRARST